MINLTCMSGHFIHIEFVKQIDHIDTSLIDFLENNPKDAGLFTI